MDECEIDWPVVYIGKFKNANITLPQLLIRDPNYFFWAVRENIFQGAAGVQAKILAERARSILLPEAYSETHTVQYVYTRDDKLAATNIIPVDQGPHFGSSKEVRKPFLDLGMPGDKMGAKLLVKRLKYNWFGDKSLTKARTEGFFSNPANFKAPDTE